MKQKTILKIIWRLNKLYHVKPWREKPFKVLLATILSQRTKDEVTRKASEQLFNIADTPEKILKLSEKEISRLIYPVGFYRQKAKKIKKICRILLEEYKGEVPSKREELMKLPGVGDKTASCVLCFGFGIPTIPVDVHLNRISQRLGIAPRNFTPEKTRQTLEKLVPDKLKFPVNFTFIQFGKEICKPIKPRCEICPIRKYCRFYHSKS